MFEKVKTKEGVGYVLGKNEKEIFVVFSRSDFSPEEWAKFSKYNSPSVTKVYKIEEVSMEFNQATIGGVNARLV